MLLDLEYTTREDGKLKRIYPLSKCLESIEQRDKDLHKLIESLQAKNTYLKEQYDKDEEMQHGIDNLAEYGNKVDYLLTHSPATSILNLMGRGMYTPDKLSNYLDEVRANTEFKRHFMGHMHLDYRLNETDQLMYEDIIRIN